MMGKSGIIKDGTNDGSLAAGVELVGSEDGSAAIFEANLGSFVDAFLQAIKRTLFSA
jgi:hypothetical protein